MEPSSAPPQPAPAEVFAAVPDAVEAAIGSDPADGDSDGALGIATGASGDWLSNTFVLLPRDADGDGTPDYADTDADDDGLDDTTERAQDLDCDGTADFRDTDADGDAVDDTVDNCPGAAYPGQEDVDQDGIGDPCCAPGCGNGIVDAGEQCDDGNTVHADGCDPECHVQPGFLEECSTGSADVVVQGVTTLNAWFPAFGDEVAHPGDRVLRVGLQRCDAAPVAFGDWLLVVQMQGSGHRPRRLGADRRPLRGRSRRQRFRGAGYLGTTPTRPRAPTEAVIAAGGVVNGQLRIFGTGIGGGLRNTYTNQRTVKRGSATVPSRWCASRMSTI